MLRHLSRTLAVLAGAALLPLVAGPASAAPVPAAVSGEACTDGEGVTVVVDSTELGGGIEIGCATDPATGTEALTLAGFADTRDDAGMICAVDGLPDPCPATFEGSYWSYWYAQDGAWQAYMEGSDTAVPAAGGIEGWRWSDGSAGPDVDLASLTAGQDEVSEDGAAADEPEAIGTAPAPAPTATLNVSDEAPVDDSGFPVPLVVAVVVLAAAGAAAAVTLRRRNR